MRGPGATPPARSGTAPPYRAPGAAVAAMDRTFRGSQTMVRAASTISAELSFLASTPWRTLRTSKCK